MDEGRHGMRREAVAVPGGTMGAWLSESDGEPRPGLLVLHEIFGANGAMREVAARFAAEEGLVVGLVDLFHRQQPGVELGYSADERPRAFALLSGLDIAQAVADVEAARSWLAARPECDGRVVVMGFCLGGRLAVLGAREATAAVAFYPVRLEDHVDVLRGLRTPTLAHVGTEDGHIPREVRELLQREVRAPGSEVCVYDGAGHAFYNPHHPSHDPAAASRAHARTVAFLREQLRPNP